MIGKAGQLLDRSIVDKSVGTPERLVFEGAPAVESPLAQDQGERRAVVSEGNAIDTRAVIPPLTAAERAAVEGLKVAAKAKLRPEAAKVRDKADRALAERVSQRDGVHIATALRHIQARHEGKLLPSVPLEFDDPDIGTATVGEVLDDPDRFVGETLADPLEGIDYGRCKAMVMRRQDGELLIHSFAHGWTFYDLLLDAARLQREVEKAPVYSVVDAFVSKLHVAHLQPDEKARLRSFVATRAGVGVREIERRIKSAEEARRKKEAELAAARMPADERVAFPVPAQNAELTPVMQSIDSVLVAVEDAESPMRNASGTLSEIRTSWYRRAKPTWTPQIAFLRPKSHSSVSSMWTTR
jgi:hypothetical protein